jgi:vacuolar-type H+-ATPase catalytic subunit A/Vma1
MYSESLPILDETLKALNTEWSRHVKARMQTSTIAQGYPQTSSHLKDNGVQSSMDTLAEELPPGMVAGMYDGISTTNDSLAVPADDEI